MRLLTLVDQLFLTLENRNQPMHVGGIFIFEMPADASNDFVTQLVEQMLHSKTPPSFPFNQVLHHLLFWQTDDTFEIDHHFRHIALPYPAGIHQLMTYVSQEHGKLLNRAKPMWECHVIEGIEGENHEPNGRFALYFKIHHSMVDGVAAMRLIQKSLSQSPTEKHTLPVWSLLTRHRNQVDALLLENKSLWSAFKAQTKSLVPVSRELVKSVYERFDNDYVTTTQAPDSLLNQPVTSARQISVVSLDLNRFKQLAGNLNATLNDVVLAVCSGALRRYLLDMNALPKKPLIGFVPISLRQDNSSVGNQISFMLANLATHEADPFTRLELIKGSMNNGKKRFGRMNQASVLNYSAVVYSRAGMQIVTRLFPEYRAFNIVISNVPGSKQALYWHGAKLQSLYPASVVFNDQAMNITFCTYQDMIEFCVVACSQALPNTPKVLVYLEEALSEFERLVERF